MCDGDGVEVWPGRVVVVVAVGLTPLGLGVVEGRSVGLGVVEGRSVGVGDGAEVWAAMEAGTGRTRR